MMSQPLSRFHSSARRRPLRTAAALLALLVGGGAVGVIAAAENNKLYLDGKVASTEVRTINGTAYVRVSDVAKALNRVMVKRPDGAYELTNAGGANQVEDITGKVGDVLFTGQWRVSVLSVEAPTDSYRLKSQGEPYPYNQPVGYNTPQRTLRANTGYVLIVVHCRVTNGQKTAQTLWIPQSDSHTALADTQGESYPPVAYDVDGAPSQTKSLLPGSKIDLPMVFAVPQTATLQDFIFTANNNDSTKSRKGNDVRVHLR